MEHLIGLASLLLAVVLMLPIPLGNVLPALAISWRSAFWSATASGSWPASG
jgi:hypothetical protein